MIQIDSYETLCRDLYTYNYMHINTLYLCTHTYSDTGIYVVLLLLLCSSYYLDFSECLKTFWNILLVSLFLLGIVEVLNAVAGALLGFRTSCVVLHLLLGSLSTVCPVSLNFWKVCLVSAHREAFNWELGRILVLQMLWNNFP